MKCNTLGSISSFVRLPIGDAVVVVGLDAVELRGVMVAVTDPKKHIFTAWAAAPIRRAELALSVLIPANTAGLVVPWLCGNDCNCCGIFRVWKTFVNPEPSSSMACKMRNSA